jgi:signal transduction histidine kinase
LDIKWKNKYGYILAFIIGVYMLGFFKLAANDIIKNKSYLTSQPYFTSREFKQDIVSYFNNIQALNGIYKDFSLKSDEEKVTKEELQASKSIYDTDFRDREYAIEDSYKYEILAAEREGNKNKVINLTEAKDKELFELKKQNTKTIKDFYAEIASYKNKDYESIKTAVKGKSEVKYYITTGKNGVIVTNIESVSDITSYIKNNSLYSIKFPEKSLKSDDQMSSINQWIGSSGGEAYFIIPKDLQENSYIYANYNYSNSVRERVVKELIFGIVSLIIGIGLLTYILKKTNGRIGFIQMLTKGLQKVPLDLSLSIFIIYSFIMGRYMKSVAFFYKPYNLGQIYILTIVGFYIFCFIFYLLMLKNFIIDKKELKLEIKRSLVIKFLNALRKSAILQNTKLKVQVIILLTLLLGASSMGVVIIIISTSFGGIIVKLALMLSAMYVFCYMLIMLFYVFKISRFLSKILRGTDEIVSGNLNYVIEEKGNGDLLKVAYNINNMKNGFKKSLENEIKSERLKSELITNVSHDLKTPLTSIINYVDLLKEDGLSKEKTKEYIDVLDRKSQRLKMLIDDLFEASKMASGAVELNIERVDVTALLQQALAELDEKINNSSLTFKLNMASNKLYANLDGKRTWRVFENLINNILKYSQPETRVYIDLIEQDGKVIITMKNISSYEMDFNRDEIFERFKRGDKSRNTEGSGLGLSIAKSILELQGGSLSIETDGDLFKAKVIIPAAAPTIPCPSESDTV